MFFDSGLTWQQILGSSANGGAYYQLGYQYIAAVLNVANGASATPAEVQAAIDAATGWFPGKAVDACDAGGCEEQLGWKTTLDQYNNGVIGPPHCGSEPIPQ